MTTFQIACIIVLTPAYLAMVRHDRTALPWIPVIFLASWLCEATCIHFYGFYLYDESWGLRLWGVPVLIPVIWPMVILTGRAAIVGLFPNAKRMLPLLVGAIVFLDASLVEVAAVGSGLWKWTVSGYLGVPLIGVMGWAYFAAVMVWLMSDLNEWRRPAAIVLAPALTHILLLYSWWGFFRWVLRGDWFFLFGLMVLIVTVFLITTRRMGKIPFSIAAVRCLAAGLFVAMIAWRSPENLRVWLHLILLAVPYLLATQWPQVFKLDRGSPAD